MVKSPEINYIIRFLGRYLGGIDTRRALRSSEDKVAEWLRGELGVDVGYVGADYSALELRRLVELREAYKAEEARLQELIAEAKSMGITTQTIAGKLRDVRRRVKALDKLIKAYYSSIDEHS